MVMTGRRVMISSADWRHSVQDKVVSTLLIQALADTCGVQTVSTAALLDAASDESVACDHVEYRCARMPSEE
jgi:hypothetical protein